MPPATARSVIPAFTHHCIITRCPSTDAADAFLSNSISPASLNMRSCAVSVVASWGCASALTPIVVAVNPRSAVACGEAGCVHKLFTSARSEIRVRVNSAGNSVIGSTASTPVASVTPGVAASIFTPVYFSRRRLRAGKNRISLYVRGEAACGASATTISAAPGSVQPVR
jgi:hypothetical protein